MPAGARIDGLRELRRDLRKIDKGIDRELRQELTSAAEPLRDAAAARAPRGTRPIPKSRRPRRRLADSLRVSLRGDTVAIRSPVPHARIVHDGGRRPVGGDRGGRWIRVPARPFIADAAEGQAGRLLERLGDRVDAFARRNGFK